MASAHPSPEGIPGQKSRPAHGSERNHENNPRCYRGEPDRPACIDTTRGDRSSNASARSIGGWLLRHESGGTPGEATLFGRPEAGDKEGSDRWLTECENDVGDKN